MDYNQDRASSEELLRLMLQKMAEQPAAFTPLTYVIWYEHLLGINKPLNESIKKIFSENGKLDDVNIKKLYNKHINECTECGVKVQKLLRKDVNELLLKINSFTDNADKQAVAFGNNLKNNASKLKDVVDVDTINKIVSSIISDSSELHGSIRTLHDELEVSKEEVNKMHRELMRAKDEAITDPLTGLYNRRGFDLKVRDFIDNPTNKSKKVIVVMLDIDYFKGINDSYGHLFGDSVIKQISAILLEKTKPIDIVARFGGDEFVMVLLDTTIDVAFKLMENIRLTVKSGKIKRMVSNSDVTGFTISIGMVEATITDGINEVISKADKALYNSKNTGRNKTTKSSF